MDAFSLLDEPLWRVLYVFHHLMERDAMHALRDRVARIDMGNVTAMAFHEPKLLADELRDVQGAIRAFEDGTPAQSDPAAQRAAGLALVARIQSGRVLDPAALVVAPDDGGLVS